MGHTTVRNTNRVAGPQEVLSKCCNSSPVRYRNWAVKAMCVVIGRLLVVFKLILDCQRILVDYETSRTLFIRGKRS